MDEHNRPAHCTTAFQGILEEQIVIILQSHAAKNDQINFSLHGDAGEQLVVRLSADRENRQFLAFYERIEYVDHRNTGSDHVSRDDALRRVYGRTADIDHILGHGRAVVTRSAGTVEHTT